MGERFNAVTGEVEQVIDEPEAIDSIPDEQKPAGVASGEIQLPRVVHVRAPDGSIRAADTANPDHAKVVADALQGRGGLSVADQQSVQRYQQEKEFGDKPFLAAAAGIGRAVTFGGMDAVTAAVSPETAEGLAALREQNPLASGIAEGATTGLFALGGALGAGVGSAGTGILAKGLSAAARANPAAVAGRAGVAIENIVARRLGVQATKGAIARAAKRGLSVGLAAGAENVAIGAGEQITEAALGDDPVTAESLLARVGTNFLLGLGFGTVAGGGASLLGSGVGAAGRVTQRSRDAVKKLISRGKGVEIGDDAADLIAKASKYTVNEDASEIVKLGLSSKEFRKQAIEASKIIDDSAPVLKRNLDVIEDTIEDMDYRRKGMRMKSSVVKDMAQSANPVVLRERSMGLMGTLRTLAKEAKDNPGLYQGDGAAANKLNNIVEDIMPGLDDALHNPDGMGVGEVFLSLDRAKRELGKIASRRKQTDLTLKAQEIYQQLRGTLEDERLVGQAANVQREINAPLSRMIQNGRNFRGEFMSLGVTKKGFDDTFVANPQKIAGWLEETGTFKSQLRDERFAAQIDAYEELVDKYEKYFDFDSDMSAKMSAAKQNIAQARKQMDLVRKHVAARNQLRDLKGAEGEGLFSSLASVAPLTMLGGFAAGPAGALAGAGAGLAARVAMRPSNVIETLAKFENAVPAIKPGILAAAESREAAQAAVGGLARRVSQAVKTGGRVASKQRPVLLAFSQKDYTSAVSKVLEMSSPENMRKVVMQSADPLREDAPQTAQTFEQQVASAMEYLRSRVPPSSIPSPTPFGPGEVMPASDFEQERFMNALAAVDAPIDALEHMAANGPDESILEPIREVYPGIYQAFVTETLAQVSESGGGTVSYKTKIELSNLLGVPMDDTMLPQFNANIVGATKPAEESGAPPNRPIDPRGAMQGMSRSLKLSESGE